MKNKILGIAIIIVMLCVTISGALASNDRIEIKTKGYEQQILSFDGIQKEVNVKVNMNFKERCEDCKFNSITGKGNLRLYWFDGARNAIEFKKIKANNMVVEDDKVIINGVADTMVLYNERDSRSIRRNEPLELILNKNTNEMSVSFYGGTISDIQTKWR